LGNLFVLAIPLLTWALAQTLGWQNVKGDEPERVIHGAYKRQSSSVRKDLSFIHDAKVEVVCFHGPLHSQCAFYREIFQVQVYYRGHYLRYWNSGDYVPVITNPFGKPKPSS